MNSSVTLWLALFIGVVACQRTNFRPGACVYTFMVPRPVDVSCSGSEEEAALRSVVDELKLQLQQLSLQQGNLARRLDESEGDGSRPVRDPALPPQGDVDVYPVATTKTYVINGCPLNVHKNIVEFVPTALGSVQVRYQANASLAGIAVTYPPFSIYCTRDKRILIQSRHVGLSLLFNRTYSEYKAGFGNLQNEFWLGLEKIHQITADTNAKFTMRFEGRMTTGYENTVEYHDVRLEDENSGYRLKYARRGTATRSYGNLAANVPFEAIEMPSTNTTHPCASQHGGWWFRNRVCKQHDLNFNAIIPFWDNTIPLIQTQITLQPQFG